MGKNLTRYLSIEEIHVTNKHMKRCSTALIIMLMHIKITMTYSFTLARIATKTKQNKTKQNKTKQQQPTGADNDVEQLENLCIIGGNIKWFSHYRT